MAKLHQVASVNFTDHLLRFRIFGCLTLAMAAPGVQSADADFSAVTAIFARECVMCHQPYDAKGELTLHPTGAWQSLVSVRSRQADMLLVQPGNIEQSYLYRKLTNTHTDIGGSGDRMPFDAELTDEQLATIRGWIEQGAEDG